MSDDQKRRAGEAAAERVEAGMVVGLGTGSTAAWFVKALAARNLPDLRCVPTSEKTADLARELGLTLSTLEDTPRIDMTVDGADEIGAGLALIKGGGAALLREKLVWEASARCICIADAAKVVKVLGAFPLPIEVVAFGHKTTANRIADVLTDHDIAMVSLAQIDPDADTSAYASILNVFNDPDAADSLTQWDTAYLAGLYDAERTRKVGRASRSEIAASIQSAHQRLNAIDDNADEPQ